MPVSYIPSAEQLVDRQKTTAKKRRRNQNAEIDELAKLLPVKALPLGSSNGLEAMMGEASSRGKPQPVDKISVLRITSTFLKFQEFLKNGYFSFGESTSPPNGSSVSGDLMSDLMAEAMDGFLIAMDNDAVILFASESITSYIGLTQHDVIGQNLEDITHPDDAEIIKDNLTPKATLPPGITNKTKDTQPRQFYIRFKSTMSPGRVQLSRFNSYTMVQVTGNLKVHIPDSDSKDWDSQKAVIGFVGECRLIESTASILEISIPQSYFTTTISMEMKIVSVESQMKELIGFTADEFIGTRLRDYFHPADYTKLIPCEVMLMHTGHAVSPVFRFMAATGGWVWMQMEGILRYKPGTKERQFWEIKVKMVSQEEGHVSLIEQNELYTLNPDPNQDILNPHKDRNFLSKLSNSRNRCTTNEGAEPIIKSLEEAKLPQSLVDGVLHGREIGLKELPGNVKRVLHHNQADAFKVKLRQSLADGTWGKPEPPPSKIHKGLEAELSSSSLEVPLSRATWGMSDSFPEDQPVSSPGLTLSPTPTITSTLSSLNSELSSSVSASLSAQTNIPYGSAGATPTPIPEHVAISNQPHVESLQMNSDQHTITYYTTNSRPVPSPESSHASPYVPPVLDSSPTHSLFYNTDTYTGSNPNSAVSSPAPSSGVGMYYSGSPAPSFVSDTSIPQGANVPLFGQRPGSHHHFSLRPADAAISSMFGNTSTDSVPNFSFQAHQHGGHVPFQREQPTRAPPTSSMGDNELCQILDNLDSMESNPSPQERNTSGDQILEQLLSEANTDSSMEQQSEPGSTGEIRYYDVDASHHMMSGDVTVAASGQYVGVVDQQMGGTGNSDIMEILSQFS